MKKPLVVLTLLCVWPGSRAWAASDAYDPARLAGVWSGTRTTTPKGSSCSMGKRESDRVVSVRLTIEVKPDGTFVGTLAMGPEYKPLSPPWRGQIVARLGRLTTCQGRSVPTIGPVELQGPPNGGGGE